MITDRDDDLHEPTHASSPTDHILQELQLYGYRPFQDEPDPRPLPEGRIVSGAVADIFDALIAALQDTRLEPDLGDLLWSTVNLFHRAAERIERELDDNEQAQRRSQREQDGGEVKSVELERLTAEGQTLLERRDAFELMRDHPIRAKKARYYEDRRFAERILPPPKEALHTPRLDDWSALPVRAPSTDLVALSKAEDEANGGLRREPELPDHVAIVKETTRRDANEFAIVDDTPEQAARQQEIVRQRMGGLARQGAMDPAYDLDL